MSPQGKNIVFLRCCMCALCAGLPPFGNCQIYVGADSTGSSVVLSNFKSDATPELLLSRIDNTEKVPVPPQRPFRSLASTSAKAEKLHRMVDAIGRRVNVSPQLIHAVISAESSYNQNAISPRGAIGLMQLLPSTALRFGVNNPNVAEENILAGASYLKWLTGYFGGDVELILAAYNAGEQAVVKAGRRVPNYPETQAYVRRVMADLHSTGGLQSLNYSQ